MERGAQQRATGATKLNELSSRSHAVFIIIVEKSTVTVSDAAAAGAQMADYEGIHPGVQLHSTESPCVRSHRDYRAHSLTSG